MTCKAAANEYLSRAIEGARAFLSKWPSDIRNAKDAADSLWSYLGRVKTIRPLKVVFYVGSSLNEPSASRLGRVLNYLASVGHQVTVLARDPIPDWLTQAAVKAQVPVSVCDPDKPAGQLVGEADVVVGESWRSMWDLMLCTSAEPVVLELEEDAEMLYDDPVPFGTMLELPVPLVCFSGSVTDVFALYGRSAALITSEEDVEQVISLLGTLRRSSLKR